MDIFRISEGLCKIKRRMTIANDIYKIQSGNRQNKDEDLADFLKVTINVNNEDPVLIN